MIHVLMPHVTAELAFFEVQVEVLDPQAALGGQADFGDAPKGFDAVDMVAAGGELVPGISRKRRPSRLSASAALRLGKG